MVEPERVDKEGTKRGLAFDSCRFGLTDHNGDRGGDEAPSWARQSSAAATGLPLRTAFGEAGPASG